MRREFFNDLTALPREFCSSYAGNRNYCSIKEETDEHIITIYAIFDEVVWFRHFFDNPRKSFYTWLKVAIESKEFGDVLVMEDHEENGDIYAYSSDVLGNGYYIDFDGLKGVVNKYYYNIRFDRALKEVNPKLGKLLEPKRLLREKNKEQGKREIERIYKTTALAKY